MELYLRDCINSILYQSIDDYEVILVDDCSSDSSFAICEEYQKRDARFHVIHHPEQRGVASARNSALEKAKGEYFLFLDSDDCIHPRLLETCLKEIKTADIVIFEYARFSRIEEVTQANSQPLHIVPEELSRQDFLLEFLGYVNNPRFRGLCCNKMYKSTLFHNIRFPDGFKYGEDSKVTYEVAKCLNKAIYLCNSPLYYYRFRSDSTINSPYTNNQNEILFIYNYIYNDISFETPQYIPAAVYSWAIRYFDLLSKAKKANLKNSIAYIICPIKWRDILSCRKITIKQKILLLLLKYHIIV